MSISTTLPSGYEQTPVEADEFSVWEEEQAWADERDAVKYVGISLRALITNKTGRFTLRKAR